MESLDSSDRVCPLPGVPGRHREVNELGTARSFRSESLAALHGMLSTWLCCTRRTFRRSFESPFGDPFEPPSESPRGLPADRRKGDRAASEACQTTSVWPTSPSSPPTWMCLSRRSTHGDTSERARQRCASADTFDTDGAISIDGSPINSNDLTGWTTRHGSRTSNRQRPMAGALSGSDRTRKS